jgi:hypothetical protein
MHTSTFSHFFPSYPTRRCWKIFTITSLLFLFFQGLQAQTRPTACTICGQTITLPGGESATATTGAGQAICIQGTGSFAGTVNLNGNNSALCIGPNVRVAASATINFNGNNTVVTNFGTWEEPFDLAGNRIAIVDNYGTMTIIGNVAITGNAAFTNYGQLIISGILNISASSSAFRNAAGATATVNGNVTVQGGGGGGGQTEFTNDGTMNVTGSFTQQENSRSVVTGPLNITGNLTIQDGNFIVTRAIITVGGQYTQSGANTFGGIDPTTCGSFNVSGSRTLSGGTFGAGGTFLGMCPTGTNAPVGTSGFNLPISNGTIGPNGNLICSCAEALPVTLLYFTARQNNNRVTLYWATASETDNNYFSIEKSRDGQQFNEAGRVAGAGTSVKKLTYQFNDDFPSGGASYYRLKQVDLDGTFTYSKTVKVSSDVTSALRVYPNPLTNNELWVEASGDQNTDMRIIIQNAIGKPVLDATYAYDPVVKVNLTTLRGEPGLYIITVRRKNRVERQKLVIQ